MEINELAFERKYKKLLYDILKHGTIEENRTGVSTYTLANQSITFDCEKYKDKAPVITAKKVYFKKALGEFMWMYMGESDLTVLHKYDVKWWDEYANDDGIVERSYGHQLRYYNDYFDQIEYVIEAIKGCSRRAHMTFWNPSDLGKQELPCCYTGMTFTKTGEHLNMLMSFRSSDVFLGLPYDMIVGFLFLDKMCNDTGLKRGEITYSLANAHVYSNHFEAVETYARSPMFPLPEYDSQTRSINNYKSGPYIPAKLNN
jgi:thymidylate synthase